VIAVLNVVPTSPVLAYIFLFPSLKPQAKHTHTQKNKKARLWIDVTDFRGVISQDQQSRQRAQDRGEVYVPDNPLEGRHRGGEDPYPLRVERLKANGEVSYVVRIEDNAAGVLRAELQHLSQQVFPNPRFGYLCGK
jgi:hypothetical protein